MELRIEDSLDDYRRWLAAVARMTPEQARREARRLHEAVLRAERKAQEARDVR